MQFKTRHELLFLDIEEIEIENEVLGYGEPSTQSTTVFEFERQCFITWGSRIYSSDLHMKRLQGTFAAECVMHFLPEEIPPCDMLRRVYFVDVLEVGSAYLGFTTVAMNVSRLSADEVVYEERAVRDWWKVDGVT